MYIKIKVTKNRNVALSPETIKESVKKVCIIRKANSYQAIFVYNITDIFACLPE